MFPRFPGQVQGAGEVVTRDAGASVCVCAFSGHTQGPRLCDERPSALSPLGSSAQNDK